MPTTTNPNPGRLLALHRYRYRVSTVQGAVVGGGTVLATDWAAAHRTAHAQLVDPTHRINPTDEVIDGPASEPGAAHQ